MAYRITRALDQRINVDWPANTTGILTISMQLKLASLPASDDTSDRFGLIIRTEIPYLGYYAFLTLTRFVVGFENGSYPELNVPYTPTTAQTSVQVVWDFSTTTASLKAFVNGSQVGSTFTATRGTVSSGNTRSCIGGFNGMGMSTMDGTVAEVAAWDVELTADELASLVYSSPLRIRPQNQLRYWPLVRELIELRTGSSVTGTNAPTVVDHPRIFL